MDMNELRQQIDGIDRQIVDLYCRRMDVARAIGRYKQENNLPVLDSERERNLLNKVAELAGEENEQGIRALYHLLLDHSEAFNRVLSFSHHMTLELLDIDL